MQALEIGAMKEDEVDEAARMMIDALHENYITDIEIEMGIAVDENTISEKAYEIVRSQIAQLINDKNAGVFSARINGKMVGYAIVVVEGKVADFWDIVVKKEHRRGGIGTALIARVERFASEKGCNMIKLDVNLNNSEAIRLYSRLGYRGISMIMVKGDMKGGLNG